VRIGCDVVSITKENLRVHGRLAEREKECRDSVKEDQAAYKVKLR